MASLSSRSRNGKVIGDITTLRSHEIRDLLKKAGIKFDDGAPKPQLQATLALYNLGLLKKRETPNEKLLSTITDWCNISVKKLVNKLKYRGLDISGTRWEHVEVLIRAELDSGQPVLASLKLSEPADKIAESSKPDLTPSPAVVNLLLTTIYAEVARSNDLASLPGCPTTTVAKVLQQLNTFPTFKSPQHLETARKAPSTAAKKLLNWICNTHGDHLVEATGSLKIRGMPDSVIQFVVSKPTPELAKAFARRKAAKRGKSILLFHGTRLPNIRDILLTNFTPSIGAAVWMAAEPAVSYDYAAGVAGNGTYFPPPSMWKGDPYKGFGALLGCEVAGSGHLWNHASWPDVHTIGDPDDIMVRYIFLLPPADLPPYYEGRFPNAPKRAAIVDDIMKNVGKI